MTRMRVILDNLFWGIYWVLPRLSNSWIINRIWLYIALNGTPSIDCYWMGAVPKVSIDGMREPAGPVRNIPSADPPPSNSGIITIRGP